MFDSLTVLAEVSSTLCAFACAYIGVSKLIDALATLVHLDRYDEWLGYSSEKLSKLLGH